MKFTKMHGAGNDYIYINCFEEKVDDPSGLARTLSDRHFGVGSDGLVLIKPSDVADFKMDMYNQDGSQAEMCGNAIRCVGKYVYDNGLTSKKEITVETLAGIKSLWLNVDENNLCTSAKVNMGEPILDPKLIPVKWDGERLVSEEVKYSDLPSESATMTCVSMGNPHAVIFLESLEEVENLEIEKNGPKIENSSVFPNRTNVEFVYVINRNLVRMRVWERGSGETLACGTGACAVLVACVLNGYTERSATIKLNGGDLLIEWDEETNQVFMTGPCTKVFDGVIDVK